MKATEQEPQESRAAGSQAVVLCVMHHIYCAALLLAALLLAALLLLLCPPAASVTRDQVPMKDCTFICEAHAQHTTTHAAPKRGHSAEVTGGVKPLAARQRCSVACTKTSAPHCC